MDTARLLQMIGADAYARHLGFRLVESPEEVVVGMTVAPEHLNFLGGTHGGVVFSLADCALSLVSNAEQRAVAIDTHLVITSGSSLGDVLTARAAEVSKGRNVATYRITVTRQDGRVVGLFTGTVLASPV